MTNATTDTADGLNIIFAGTPEFSAEHLQALIDQGRHNIVAVYTQPDRQSGRGKKVLPTPVKKLALEHGITVFQPLSLKPEEALTQLASHKADLMVVVAYGLLLPQAVLDTPRLGCINVHASILPRWRGAAPIERCIEAGDNETGVTIMQMAIGLDTGDMISKSTLAIEDNDTGDSLRKKLSLAGQPALLEVCDRMVDNAVKGEEQDDSLSNYASKLNKLEAVIDWHLDAQIIEQKIRAFNSTNVCYSDLNGERIKIWSASIVECQQEIAPGTIIECSKKRVVVRCGHNALLLKQLQLPGKKAMDTAAVLNSRRQWFSEGNCFV